MSKRTDRNQFIPDRRIIAALEKGDPEPWTDSQLEAVRELIQEAWHLGYSAGQMKERLSRVSGHSPVF